MDVGRILRKAEQLGVCVSLWNNKPVWSRDELIPQRLKDALESVSDEALGDAVRLHLARLRLNPKAPHKWLIRLGDRPSRKDPKPAYMACGSGAWCKRLVAQARKFGDTQWARGRWMTLDLNKVSGFKLSPGGILIAKSVTLPPKIRLGGAANASAQVISACKRCLQSRSG